MSRRSGPRAPLVAAGVAILLLGAGCADDPEEAPVDSVVATPTPDPTPSPEPTELDDPEPTETPAFTDEPEPELNLVGDDYGQIVRSYTAYRTWLFRHPDPDLFDNITHPDCECYIQKDLLAHYEEEGLRWVGEGPGIQVQSVNIVDDQGRNLVHLEVVFERSHGGQLVDADGVVHDEVEPLEPWVEELVFLREDQSAPWKLRDFIERGPLEEVGRDE